MSQLLHFYEKHRVTEAAVEGGDVLALCGVAVEPRIEDAHILPVKQTNKDQCGRCFTILRARGGALQHNRRKWARTMSLAHAKDPQEG
ncbi:DUF3039 domain-containing protein [Nesterenkonia sp. CF4.4]|uniref:DUF3039 domain-containing protein n=1 Tax=Nesterenkonia sp. CF4.4 TaxID=3373079 RepID=UPI003EE819F2